MMWGPADGRPVRHRIADAGPEDEILVWFPVITIGASVHFGRQSVHLPIFSCSRVPIGEILQLTVHCSLQLCECPATVSSVGSVGTCQHVANMRTSCYTSQIDEQLPSPQYLAASTLRIDQQAEGGQR